MLHQVIANWGCGPSVLAIPLAPSMQREQLTRSLTPQQRGSVAAARPGCSVEPFYRLHGARVEALHPLRHAKSALQPPAARGSCPRPLIHHTRYKHVAQCRQVPSAQTSTCTIIPVPFAQPVPRALAGLSQCHCRQRQATVFGKAGTMGSKGAVAYPKCQAARHRNSVQLLLQIV